MNKKCIIISNKHKELALELHTTVENFLISKGIHIISKDEIEKAHFAIVIGGDGTLLRASKEIIKKTNIPIIAINAGSLGFLTEIEAHEAIDACENFLSGDFSTFNRGMLELTINDVKYDILNEVVISNGRLDKKLISVELSSDHGKINTYIGDGLILATPTGSTAYSLSAGGPIVSYHLGAIIVTPISPHNLSTRSLVLSDEENIYVKVNNENMNNFLMIDGDFIKNLTTEDCVSITSSKKKLNLVLPRNRNYYSVLKEKLKWG